MIFSGLLLSSHRAPMSRRWIFCVLFVWVPWSHVRHDPPAAVSRRSRLFHRAPMSRRRIFRILLVWVPSPHVRHDPPAAVSRCSRLFHRPPMSRRWILRILLIYVSSSYTCHGPHASVSRRSRIFHRPPMSKRWTFRRGSPTRCPRFFHRLPMSRRWISCVLLVCPFASCPSWPTRLCFAPSSTDVKTMDSLHWRMGSIVSLLWCFFTNAAPTVDCVLFF
ncbi:hypothetical protein BD779DRAFT_1721340 [Infundibulicybe gibba]|nr:hypothetical protein BD779DRAFT_1721340 [Infundibulicybe gibba]